MTTNYTEDELRAMSEALGDAEFSMPYIPYLEKDPLLRLGFDPAKVHFADRNKYDQLNIAGFYNDPLNPDEDSAKFYESVARFMPDGFQGVQDDSAYVLPMGSDTTWPVSPIAMHELRHRGISKYLDAKYPNRTLGQVDIPAEELLNRMADRRIGIPALWESYYNIVDELPQRLQDKYAGYLDTLQAEAQDLVGEPASYDSYYRAPFDPDVFEQQQRAHIANIDAAWVPQQQTVPETNGIYDALGNNPQVLSRPKTLPQPLEPPQLVRLLEKPKAPVVTPPLQHGDTRQGPLNDRFGYPLLVSGSDQEKELFSQQYGAGGLSHHLYRTTSNADFLNQASKLPSQQRPTVQKGYMDPFSESAADATRAMYPDPAAARDQHDSGVYRVPTKKDGELRRWSTNRSGTI